MGEIVNLRLARKKRDRNQRDQAAEANRVKHGLAKVEKNLSAARRAQASRKLDGHKLESDQESNQDPHDERG
jgi:hypothetical protein